MNKQRENIRRIMTSVNLINQTYEYMAKKLGITDEMLSLIYALDDGKIYTQKHICELWNIPKTTINAVIQNCKDKQLITLEENPLNKKEKYIRITEYGKMFSNEILKPLYALEEKAYVSATFNEDNVLKLEEFSDLLNLETKKYFNALFEIANKNELNILKQKECIKYYKDIEKLYFDAFPSNERIDVSFFYESIENLELFVFTHNDQFAGFAFALNYDNIVYLLYFAMKSKCRGKGFGSQALELIKREKKGKTILLDVEVENMNSLNSLQRIKRKKFYLRAGFFETTITYMQKNNKFEILCFGTMIDSEQIEKIWQQMPEKLMKQYRK